MCYKTKWYSHLLGVLTFVIISSFNLNSLVLIAVSIHLICKTYVVQSFELTIAGYERRRNWENEILGFNFHNPLPTLHDVYNGFTVEASVSPPKNIVSSKVARVQSLQEEVLLLLMWRAPMSDLKCDQR